MTNERSTNVLMKALIGALALTLLFLTGCSTSFQTDEEIIAESLESAINAIESGSINENVTAFSEAALTSRDLLEGLKYAHELLEDRTIVDIQDEGSMQNDEYEAFQDSRFYQNRYTIITNDGTYVLYLKIYTSNTFNPKKEGIYWMYFDTEEAYLADIEEYNIRKKRAYAKGEAVPEWNFGADHERAGIYYPGW